MVKRLPLSLSMASEGNLAPLTVLIVAGTTIMRVGLTSLLADEPDIQVVGWAADHLQLQRLLPQQPLHVVLVCCDTELNISGSTVAQLTKTHHPNTKVLLLCPGHELAGIRTLIIAGIDGYLPLRLGQEALVKAVRDVQHYGFVIAANTETPPQFTQTTTPLLGTALTHRELEVLQTVAQGHTNPEIATLLHISVDTVRTHLKHLYAKLSVDSRPALIRIAVFAGITPAGDAPP